MSAHFLLRASSALLISLATVPVWCADKPAQASNAATPTLTEFGPTGMQRDVRQVRLRFSQPMAALGDSSAPAAAQVACEGVSAQPRGRWIDPMRWVAEFENALPDGVVCTVQAQALKSLAGAAVPAAKSWRFDTGGPRVVSRLPWSEASELAITAFQSSAPVAAESLRHLTCRVNERSLPVTILQGDEREQAWASLHKPDDKIKSPGPNWILARCGGNTWPNSASVEWRWGKAIAAPTGAVSLVDQNIDFSVRPAFGFSTACTHLGKERGCDARHDLVLEFTAPLLESFAAGITLSDEKGKLIKGSPTWHNADGHVQQWRFAAPFVAGQRLQIHFPPKLEDKFGRTLDATAKQAKSVQIASLPAYLGMLQTSGVSPGSNGNWPLVIRNVEPALLLRRAHFGVENTSSPDLIALHRRVETMLGNAELVQQNLGQAFVASQAFLKPLKAVEVQEIALVSSATSLRASKQPASPGQLHSTDIALPAFGSWVVEVDSPLVRQQLQAQLQRDQSDKAGLARNTTPEERQRETQQWLQQAFETYAQPRLAVVQQTNLNIHASISHQGESLVWVTSFDSGQALAGVTLEVWSCDNQMLQQSQTDSMGRVRIAAGTQPKACSDKGEGLWLIARQQQDRALLHAGNGGYYGQTKMVVHSVLDRTLLHAGETVSMQHLLRQQVPEGWRMAQPQGTKLRILFNGDQVHEQMLQWQADGSADSAWAIPPDAKLGGYQFSVLGPEGEHWYGGSFQVEEFRTPAFEASLTAKAAWQGERQSMDLRGALSFLAGGAAARAPVSITTRFRPGARAPVVGYRFESEPRDYPDKALELPVMQMKLDNHGQMQREILAPKFPYAQTFVAEMTFTDPNGETQTESMNMAVWPQRHKIGLRIEPSVRPNRAELSAILLDENDKPLAKQPLQLLLGREQGATSLCELLTDDEGKARCEIDVPAGKDGKPGKPGSVASDYQWVLQARAAQAQTLFLGVDNRYLRWGSTAAVLELVDSKRLPRAGEAAQVRVRAPFLPATLLLTLEREGVFASQLHTLTEPETEISVPILNSFTPAVQLHAQFVRGSAQGGIQNHQANLALALDPASHRLNLAITPAQAEARPGQSMAIKVKASQTLNGQAAAGASLTLVVVDEALLALKNNPSWKILEPFWRTRTVDVAGYQMNLPDLALAPAYEPTIEQFLWHQCAWQQVCPFGYGAHFGYGARAVAAPAPMASAEPMAALSRSKGGGNGDAPASSPRQNLSTLAAWRTHVQLDEKGEASINITLPDSLTKWRIVAMATQGADRFGTGEAALVVNQPLQIISGLPQLLRSGDQVRQQVTLRNTSDKALKVNFEANASSDAAISTPGMKHARQLQLAAGENKVVDWVLSVPDHISQLNWTLRANAGSENDALQFSQSVVPLLPLTVRDATLVQVKQPISIALAQAANARAGGQVRVNWQASLVDGPIASARQWMANYPYACMEQRSSKAVVSGDKAQWQAAMATLPKHLQSNGLVSYFPETAGSENLTAYLLDIADAYQLPLPPDAKARMQQALQEALLRPKVLDWLPDNDILAHKLALQAAIAPNLGQAKPVEPPDLNNLPTIALLDWVRYLLTTTASSTRQQQLELAANHLRSRYDIQGTRLVWRDDKNDGRWWFMWSSDVALARTVVLVQQWQQLDAAWQANWQADLPLLIAALADKQKAGSWRTTTGNAWAVAALSKFATQSEAGKVSGSSSAVLAESSGKAAQSYAWPGEPAKPLLEPSALGKPLLDPASLQLPWPDQRARVNLNLSHQGQGAPWATVQVLSRVPGNEQARGITVQKIITPVNQRVPGKWSVGDVMKVTLKMNSELDLGWVVVRDPVPSGASILGKGLGRESALAQEKVQSANWWWNSGVVERGNESYRSYYPRIWRGKWQAEYVLRLNNAGSFNFPATRIEAMYAPEIYGETPNPGLQVQVNKE